MGHKVEGDITVKRMADVASIRYGTTTIVTANTTVSLGMPSTSVYFLTGSTVGLKINLGDATTRLSGHYYNFVNQSSVPVTFIYNDTTTFMTLPAGFSAKILLQTNSTANGVWAYTTSVVSFPSSVLNVVLTGLSLASSIAITASDTILDALGKLQAQITTLINRNINSGTGLSGGGNLSADRTLSIANTTVSAGSYGSSTAIPIFTVNAQGQLTSAGTATPAMTMTEINDTANDTRSNTADALLASMTATPPAGTYRFEFNSTMISNTPGAAISYSFYVGGVQVASTLRKIAPADGGALSSGDARGCTHLVAKLTVNGSQAVEVRWSISSGTATCGPRTLNYERRT